MMTGGTEDRTARLAPVLPGGGRSWELPRVEDEELLDQGRGTPADVRANLAEMWRINHVLGGMHAVTAHLYPRLIASGGGTVADLGAGSAHLTAAVAQWARSRGIGAQVIGVDWADRNLTVARERNVPAPQIALLQADAARLPFRAGSVDFVMSSLFMHHFAPDQLVALLRDAYACTRRALIMSDLVRGWLPLAAFRLVQPVFARHYLTRHDGALSVRRAYTPAELREIAARAGLVNARVYTHWPWRMTLVVDR